MNQGNHQGFIFVRQILQREWEGERADVGAKKRNRAVAFPVKNQKTEHALR